MERWIRFDRLGVVVLLGVLAALIARPSSGQDQTEERLSSLETRVTELEAAVVSQGTPESSAAGEAAAEASTAVAQATIGGNALDLLPPGEGDAVAVIVSGPLENGKIPLVVRNNTESAVAGVTVKVEARDASGALVAVGETTGGQALKPYLLHPGEVAIGFASLQGDVPLDAVLTYAVASEPAPGMMGGFNVDLAFDEVTWLSDRIVGVARNPGDQAVGGTYMNLVCFAPDGTPSRAEPSTIQEDVAPGGTAPFQIDGGYVTGCERFLVAATAHPRQ